MLRHSWLSHQLLYWWSLLLTLKFSFSCDPNDKVQHCVTYCNDANEEDFTSFIIIFPWCIIHQSVEVHTFMGVRKWSGKSRAGSKKHILCIFSNPESVDNLEEENWGCQENCLATQLKIAHPALAQQIHSSVGLADLDHTMGVIDSHRDISLQYFSSKQEMARLMCKRRIPFLSEVPFQISRRGKVTHSQINSKSASLCAFKLNLIGFTSE